MSSRFFRHMSVSAQRGLLFGGLILTALLFFEVFNYSTTDFALQDLLGDMRFLGIRWSTILAIAFCGIDFAGIARIFTPEQGREEPIEVWYLFGAWLLAATMNAMLTWWGVSVALVNHMPEGSQVLSYHTITRVVPIFVAVLVWLIRVMIIGTISVAGERLFTVGEASLAPRRVRSTPTRTPRTAQRAMHASSAARRVSTPATSAAEPQYEPLYAEGRASSPAARF
ncbi:MAG TPA: hypothetical protein G4O04_10540 [Anaerolineae bacterium]|nr:hypothetical protein [Anaerolineae bacterium]HID83979.1 hypothetical protein [Anaerolineales bacterium]HIQ08154.1 hypothetical protein [Anaerolineaceae bacterium]